MTGQIHDRIQYPGEAYSRISTVEGLPQPVDFGRTPVMVHMPCWRGFYNTFAAQAKRLWLVQMTVKSLLVESGRLVVEA